MATARSSKKKPTAAQLAARAEFARIMKSGGFKSKRRRKNPTKTTVPISRSSSARLSGSTKRPAPPPPARRAAPEIRRTSSSPGPIRTNPIYPAVRFEVWRCDRAGHAQRFIGAFASKADAVTFARLYADNKGQRVGVKIRGKAH